MSEFIAPSGAKVVVNVAPWKDAKALKKAIQQEAAGMADLSLKADATAILGIIMKIDGSDSFDAALWPCLHRCLRNDQKVVESMFDDADCRKDYYEIVINCVKENLGPLAEGASSLLPKGLLAMQNQEKSPA